ncbi:hypothetical protein NMG60_11034933 [Bertholletia excelsa]
MTDSAANPQIKEDEDNRDKKSQRLCDFCGESVALIYCRADSAKLCLSCDREVHSTNQLFTKHTRSQLCDVCDSTPASILCSTENFVLCQNCDWERHNLSLSPLHERRTLEGFTGCPTVNELLAIVGFEDVGKKALFGGDELVVGSGVFGPEGFSDLLVWDTPSIVTLDDLIGSNNCEHSFQAMGVPPLPKNRKAACGQYKEEILGQLREMSKSEPDFGDGRGDIEPLMQFQSLLPQRGLQPQDVDGGLEFGAEVDTVPSHKVTAFWQSSDIVHHANQVLPSKLARSYVEENCLVPDKDLDVGGSANANFAQEEQLHHCVVTESSHVFPKTAIRELTSQERDSAISRYKEKKKNRRYDKHIRYESRKIRAEGRTRIKGRFAKMDR